MTWDLTCTRKIDLGLTLDLDQWLESHVSHRQTVSDNCIIDHSSTRLVLMSIILWSLTQLAGCWQVPPPFLRTDPVERLLTRDENRGRESAAYMQLPHTELCLALDHMPVLPLSVPTSLAGFSSQCKWVHSAASWQSRASDKRMVQTWHTFKKFSLPSPNPLHCKQGWHVPNEIGAFVSENSPPLSGIVSSKTTRSHSWGKRYSRGCYATPAAM